MVNMTCFTTPKQLYETCHTHHRMMTSRRGTLSPCLCRVLTSLNHFNFRLRPAALRPPCLTFGVTSACPMFATRWLTYLAGTGFSPAGIIDLARPHTPLISILCCVLPIGIDLSGVSTRILSAKSKTRKIIIFYLSVS